MPAALPVQNRGGRPRAPELAPKGISPKDLLLTTMRAAWVQAYALDAHIGDLEADLVLLNENRPGQSATNHPRLLFLLGVERGVVIPTDRWDAAAVGGKKELDRVKGERVKLIAQATGLAKDAAVYEHPRLANTDTKLSGDINITIKKY